MFGRLGWMEILVIVLLVFILFGHNKIPQMMKNLANGLNVFKKELKSESKEQRETSKNVHLKKVATKKTSVKKKPTKKK